MGSCDITKVVFFLCRMFTSYRRQFFTWLTPKPSLAWKSVAATREVTITRKGVGCRACLCAGVPSLCGEVGPSPVPMGHGEVLSLNPEGPFLLQRLGFKPRGAVETDPLERRFSHSETF